MNTVNRGQIWALLTVSLLAACGPAEESDDTSGLEQAANLASRDGRVKLKDKTTRERATTSVLVSGTIAGISEPSASIGLEPFAGLRTARGGKVELRFDAAAVARVLAGGQPHLLATRTGGKAVVSFDLVPRVKLTGRGATLSSAVVVGGSEKAYELLVTMPAEVTAVKATTGTAALVNGLEQTFRWTFTLDEAAAAIATARNLQVKVTTGTKSVPVQAAISLDVWNPTVRDVPADFHAGVVTLAEDPMRKLDTTGADAAAVNAMVSVAMALRDEPALDLNIARIGYSGTHGITIYRGFGALTGEGTARTESWWLSEQDAIRRLETALHGLPFVLVDEGAEP